MPLEPTTYPATGNGAALDDRTPAGIAAAASSLIRSVHCNPARGCRPGDDCPGSGECAPATELATATAVTPTYPASGHLIDRVESDQICTVSRQHPTLATVRWNDARQHRPVPNPI
ncbi:hypothetical protein [Nocardia australiensis]|uniref:hypothetical protein n=1 Tax=Nocardia australiensis TaxID=2887191 RepID=UPI001D139677|nr:hypothetical protein [Nocardia australiensis]